MNNLEESYTFTYNIAKSIVKESLPLYFGEIEKVTANQINAEIHPKISNAIYHRINDVIEEERFNTLIALARVLDNESMGKAINSLNYTLGVKEQKEK